MARLLASLTEWSDAFLGLFIWDRTSLSRSCYSLSWAPAILRFTLHSGQFQVLFLASRLPQHPLVDQLGGESRRLCRTADMGYLVTRTHSFSAGLSYLVGSLCLSGILMLPPEWGVAALFPVITWATDSEPREC